MKRLGLPVIPALVIAGGINSAQALELGDIEVQSRLGQPLRASIAYALAPNEQLADYCVSLARTADAGGVPGLSRAAISVSQGRITITGDAPVTEPLLSARLSVSCPYTAQITREYTLFVDPSDVPAETRLAAAPQAAPTTTLPASTTTLPAPARADVAPPARVMAADEPVATGSSYRVVTGDSLSAIAARLEGREVSVTQAATAILAANPDAFIDGNPDRLKAGSLLAIPAVAGLGDATPRQPVDVPATAAAPAPVQPAAAIPAPQPVASATEAAEPAPGEPAPIDDTAYLAPATTPEQTTAAEPAVREVAGMTIDSSATESSFEDGGDTVLEPAPSASATAIAPAAAPATISDSGPAAGEDPVSQLPTAPVRDTGGSNAVWWTLGGALVVIGGLFVARRRKTEDEDIVTKLAARAPNPTRQLADDSIEVQIIDSPESGQALDFDLSDDSPTAENPALDADLVEGRGLGGTEKPGTADFGFAETTDLDLEITEAAAREPEDQETDMIPPPSRETASILESEVLPDETGYDMSVIMDVTKMPAPEEATERDLMAVRVDDHDPTLNEENYTLSKEVDYRILEQDYEEELTATQALNVQIEEAARELAANLGEAVTVESETLAGDEAAALDLGSPSASETVAALDDTAFDDSLTINLDSLDETGVNEELGIDFDVGESTAFNEALTENFNALGSTGISAALQEDLVAADDTGINEVLTETLDAVDATGINDALTETLDAADATGINEALTETLDAVDASDIDDELTISLDPNDKTAVLERSSANEDFDDKTVEMEIESGKTDSRAR